MEVAAVLFRKLGVGAIDCWEKCSVSGGRNRGNTDL